MTFVYFLLLTVLLVLIQFSIGGTQFAYAFPTYAIAGVTAILTVFSIRRPAAKVSPACLGSALLFAGYVLVRAWFSPNPYLARSDAFQAVACLIVYLLTALYLTGTRQRLWAILSLLVVAAVHVGIGAYQFKEGNNYMLFGFDRGDTQSFRASGLLICPNHMAGFLEALALFALSLTFWSRLRITTKLLLGYLVLLCYAAVAMSGSRGGYLSSVFSLLVFVGLTIWMVRIINRERFPVALIGMAVGVALLIGLAGWGMAQSPAIRLRLHRLATATQDVRQYNWLATLDQFKLSPVVGTGAGTHLYYGRLFRRPQIQADPEHSHCDYLETLAEYGVIGALLSLTFLITHWIAGIKSAHQLAIRRLCNSFGRARSDTLALTLGSLAAVAALAAHSVVDFNMHIPGNALLFAFIFGILASPGIDQPTETKVLSLQTLLRGALVLLGIGLVGAVAVKYKGELFANQSRLALKENNYAETLRLTELAIEADPGNPFPYFYQGEACRGTASIMPNYAMQERYYNQAIESYSKGLAYFPQDENLWVRLAQSLDGVYLYEEAKEAYLKAIEADPKLGILHSYYAAHQRISGDLEGAVKSEATARSLGASNIPENEIGERPSLRSFFSEKGSSPSE